LITDVLELKPRRAFCLRLSGLVSKNIAQSRCFSTAGEEALGATSRDEREDARKEESSDGVKSRLLSAAMSHVVRPMLRLIGSTYGLTDAAAFLAPCGVAVGVGFTLFCLCVWEGRKLTGGRKRR
jgi:hypothetical protein